MKLEHAIERLITDKIGRRISRMRKTGVMDLHTFDDRMTKEISRAIRIAEVAALESIRIKLYKTTLGDTLKRARIGAKLSQRELEEVSGISRTLISRYENGMLVPGKKNLARLAQAIEETVAQAQAQVKA